MKKKTKIIAIVINSFLCIFQSFVLAFIPKKHDYVVLYFLAVVIFVILINAVPYFVSRIIQIDGADIFTAKSFHKSFLPLVIDLNNRLKTSDTINMIQLLYDWRNAVRKAEIYAKELVVIRKETISYDANKIYLEEMNNAIDVLIYVYNQCEGFKEVIALYNCKNMTSETVKLYNSLTEIKK